MTTIAANAPTSVVLVHGAFVDGSGWENVYKALRKDGYPVSIVQHATASLADDVAATRRVLDAQSGPVILVGHSYGGVVISEAGNHPKVAGLVYINAFAPDAGESVASLIKDPPPGAPVAPLVPAGEGYLALDKAKFRDSFAADVSADKAAFMADSQVPWGVAAIEGAGHRSGVEVEAELVSRRERGPHDPAVCPAAHVEARRRDRRRSRRQPFGVRVEGAGRGRLDRGGRPIG